MPATASNTRFLDRLPQQILAVIVPPLLRFALTLMDHPTQWQGQVQLYKVDKLDKLDEADRVDTVEPDLRPLYHLLPWTEASKAWLYEAKFHHEWGHLLHWLRVFYKGMVLLQQAEALSVPIILTLAPHRRSHPWRHPLWWVLQGLYYLQTGISPPSASLAATSKTPRYHIVLHGFDYTPQGHRLYEDVTLDGVADGASGENTAIQAHTLLNALTPFTNSQKQRNRSQRLQLKAEHLQPSPELNRLLNTPSACQAVVVLDDVMTTTATLTAALGCLQQAMDAASKHTTNVTAPPYSNKDVCSRLIGLTLLHVPLGSA